MSYTKPPIFLYFDTVNGKPSTHRLPAQPVQQYVNLKNLWHKPDDIPRPRESILMFNEDKELRFATLTNAACDTWRQFVSFAHIRAWIYTEDIYRTIPFNETVK